MKTNRTMTCLCGNAATRIKWGQPVCSRCDSSEVELSEFHTPKYHNEEDLAWDNQNAVKRTTRRERKIALRVQREMKARLQEVEA